MKVDNPIKAFIVGMPRGGTTYLSKLINTHKDIVSAGESLYWGRNFVSTGDNLYGPEIVDKIKHDFKFGNWGFRLKDDERQKLQVLLDEEFDKLVLPCTPEKPFDALATAFCRLYDKSIFIEKTPHHINWVGRIRKYYPDTKFIVAIRDPYDFMLSYKFQGLQKNQHTRDVHKKIYHPISCAIVWKKNYLSIKKLKQNLSADKICIMDVKDLKSGESTSKLEDFLEINHGELQVIGQDNSSFVNRDKETFVLSGIDIFWMNVVAGKEIADSGYTKKSQFPNPFMLLVSVLILPVKFYNSIVILKKNNTKSMGSYLLSYIKK